MKSIEIDWSNHLVYENVDTTCPYCKGEGYVIFDVWKNTVLNRNNLNWNRYEEVREQLNLDYKEYLADCASDDEEPFDFDGWLEFIMSEADMEDNEMYRDSYRCDHCESGYTNPVMNYAYPVDCDLSDENKRIALECGLFLFEYPGTEDVYMSLTGGGMDLSPNILLAYLRLTDNIPLEWAMEFQQDYRAYLSEAKHMEIAKACKKTILNWIKRLENKQKTIDLFIGKEKNDNDRLTDTLDELLSKTILE